MWISDGVTILTYSAAMQDQLSERVYTQIIQNTQNPTRLSRKHVKICRDRTGNMPNVSTMATYFCPRVEIHKFPGRKRCITGNTLVVNTQAKNEQKATILTDSQLIYYIFRKGRSGSERLWRISLRFLALYLATNPITDPIWIPTAKNPADGSSRSIKR